ncbi:FtsQ-type POTRA domain-containing protein [Sphingomonas lutea]|uniref:Cell division protein FtsQ n=1 Tax=Sphingomonas lutea TaxID=1045317 RepID=A0A7G9SHJ4_9SPHN|nr:cell division protein FtsQ/DivIB [Sphingomonas lutea]QNN67319.1 FtsQ-type POTRA domain-containing protein [Sphingomonas lutea]
MSAAHVRRGGGARAKPRKSSGNAVSKKIARNLPVNEARASKLAGLAFTGFLLAIAFVVLVALDIPAKAERSAGAALGRAGFVVSGYQIVGLDKMDRRIVDRVVTDELARAAETAGAGKPPQPLVDVAAIRERLIGFGWVKDARVSRRLPDTLVIDIVERKPAALWQDSGQLTLVDAEGVVLDKVAISNMPDLPLLIGQGANAQSKELGRLMASVPTLQPQLASATWVGRRRWDLSFQSGETIALPEGEQAARAALGKFAKLDRSNGLLGRGVVRFDLRIPGKMIVRLPRAPGETITGDQPPQQS